MRITKEAIAIFIVGLLLGGVIGFLLKDTVLPNTGSVECHDLPPVLQ